MRYPNIRYGNPNEFQYYAQGIPLKDLCRMLRRSEKSVTSWLNGTRKVPFWVPELMRLKRFEHDEWARRADYSKHGIRINTVREITMSKQFLIAGNDNNVEKDTLLSLRAKRLSL